MVIQFSLGNYKSFNSIQTINFRATGLASEDKTIDVNNIATIDDQNVLKILGVYGPNASGKSNLLKGLNFFKRMVAHSLENEELLAIEICPNKQIVYDPNNTGYFQIVLFLENRKYRYGFTLKNEEIATEWLYGPAEKNETWYFRRKESSIEVNKENFSEGSNIPFETKLRSDALFLSFCSSYNGEMSSKLKEFISNKITINAGNNNNTVATSSLVEDGKKEIVLKWLKDASLSFNDIIVKRREGVIGRIRSLWEVKLSKNVYGKTGEIINTITMDLNNDESDGTQKYYSLIGKLYNKFENGGLFISDEIDSNLHPSLLQKLVSMFNNPAINKANAQLLFTSHDTNLMSPQIMRRDQFYFTEKSATDATILYSLADLKGIRNNADFAKQYLAGYYGAIPILGNYLEDLDSINPEN